MSTAIKKTDSTFTVIGSVIDTDGTGVVDLHVEVYDKDVFRDDFLGLGVTNEAGLFEVSFDSSQFWEPFEGAPDLYFVVLDSGLELLNTRDTPIESADESTPPISLTVDLTNDKLRQLINETPVDGWVGGFAESNPAFAYPTPDLSSIDVQGNLDNIDKLQRQQKVLWPEFSWESKPGESDPKRCFQMFAPDISRLGYTDNGKVYSIICPQQGAASPHLGSINVEVTVTGNRGWADETNKELAADMSVEGKIWFAPSAHDHLFVKQIANHFSRHNLPFPSNKANAIVIKTFTPGSPDKPLFALKKGSSTDFPIPDFAKHESLAWSLGHLSVEIGEIVKTNVSIVDKFNQLVLDAFNAAAGNMLKEGNILSWNVWFTAPELVDQQEWTEHAIKWRDSIDSDHGSPNGDGTKPRHFDGTPFSPLKELLLEEFPRLLEFVEEHAMH